MDIVTLTNDTPTRSRTRTAILNAAVLMLADHPAASLGDIADAAHVARSTLHRYFPERSILLQVVNEFAAEQLKNAVERARPGEGRGRDALMRLCHEYFDNWPAITWIYLESLKQEDGTCEPNGTGDPDLAALIARGHADGTIDPTLASAWIQTMLWALLYSAQEYARQGESAHQALDVALRSLDKMVAPDVTHQPT